MKVELEKIVLSTGAISNNVYAGILNKKKDRFLQKVDVSNHFLDCVIKRWEGHKEIISAGNQSWEISVKKLKR